MSIESPAAEAAVLEAPPALCEVARALRGEGHAAWLVGESLHGLLRGERSVDFELSTAASPAQLLEIFPAAVVTHPTLATLTLPTKAGPIELSSFRKGGQLGDDLARRDFSILAMAYDPLDGELLDPYSGRADLAAGRLRCVERAADRLAEDALRCLRAARLCASYGYAPDRELESALAAATLDIGALPALRVRRELTRLLLSARASLGIALLRRSGLENALVPEARPDCAALIDGLPQQLEIRLAGWLRGTPARQLLRRMGISRSRSEQIGLLLENHPVERALQPARHPALRRLRHRLGEDGLSALRCLREAELELMAATDDVDTAPLDAARAELELLQVGLARLDASDESERQRAELSLGGREVMKLLGCQPGRRVGAALRSLAERVEQGAIVNTPQALREELARWAVEHPE